MEYFDVVIVGAGMSGIRAARHLRMMCPSKTFVILEPEDTYGHAPIWNVDAHASDENTSPWSIWRLADRARTFRHWPRDRSVSDTSLSAIRYQHRIVHARWESVNSGWSLECANGAQLSCRFLWLCDGQFQRVASGELTFPGREDFEACGGHVVSDTASGAKPELVGKRVVLVGSVAPAVALVPAVASDALFVTVLQPCPAYVLPVRGRRSSEKLLPRRFARALAHVSDAMSSKVASKALIGGRSETVKLMRQQLPEEFMSDEEFMRNFCPASDKDKSFCLDPGGAFFDAIKQGCTTMLTDSITAFDKSGVVLESGRRIECDVVIHAGQSLCRPSNVFGTIDVCINGVHQTASKNTEYNGCMLTCVPNFAFVDEAESRQSDLVCNYICRVLEAMDCRQSSICCPFPFDVIWPPPHRSRIIRGESTAADKRLLNANSSVLRLMKAAASRKQSLIRGPVDDGVLRFQTLCQC